MFFQLPEPIRDIVIARDRLRSLYEKSELTFTIDGNLLGDIGEAVAAELFGIRLTSRNMRTVDGYAPDGRSVQIKAGASRNGPAFRSAEVRADHLIVIWLNLNEYVGEVIYNGPEEPVVGILPRGFSGQRTIPLSRIRRAAEEVEAAARLPLTEKGHMIVLPTEAGGSADRSDAGFPAEPSFGEFLTRDAGRDFLFLAWLSASLGLVDDEEYALRLRILRSLLPQGDPLAESIAGEIGDAPGEELFGDNDGDLVPREKDGAKESEWRHCEGTPQADPLLIHFSSIAPGMRVWEFQPQDPDPKPSVPHGHWHNLSQPKLNPYTGRVFDGKREVTRMRLKRKAMKALWNDARFRKDVLEAVERYAKTFPWHQFPVAKPNRLPRR